MRLFPLVILCLSMMCLWKCLMLKCMSKKNVSNIKNMKFIKPFKMFSLLNYYGLNQWLEVMVFLARCITKCAWPLKARINYWQPSWIPYRNMWGEKWPKHITLGWQRVQSINVRISCTKEWNIICYQFS